MQAEEKGKETNNQTKAKRNEEHKTKLQPLATQSTIHSPQNERQWWNETKKKKKKKKTKNAKKMTVKQDWDKTPNHNFFFEENSAITNFEIRLVGLTVFFFFFFFSCVFPISDYPKFH
jgi:hypothetical protein